MSHKHCYIRVDGSQQIGSGHVMRCLVLAEHLASAGYQIEFICRSQEGDYAKYIEQQGFIVQQLPRVTQPFVARYADDYCAWLQVDERQDALQSCQIIKANSLVIIDHYGINKAWQQYVYAERLATIVVIDDLIRVHECHLLIDQTIAREPSEYLKHVPQNCELLTGCGFALLKPQFSFLRQQASQRQLPKNSLAILVSLGGVDQDNITLAILREIAKNYAQVSGKAKIDQRQIHVTVLLNRNAPHYQSVADFTLQHHHWLTHIDFTQNMADIMLAHDIAIGAPGTTTWERACLGLPSVLIAIAENQREICQRIAQRDIARVVSVSHLSDNFSDALEDIIANYQVYRQRNLAICDGLGAQKVTQKIIALTNKKHHVGHQATELKLRKATNSDTALVYKWQCLPQTRQYALNPVVPNWSEHQQWMTMKLASVKDHFYVITNELETENYGVVRLDSQQKTAEYIVSIFIDPDFYGQKIAQRGLALLDDKHPELEIKAIVLPENIASQRLFSKAGYSKLDDKTFIRLPIE